MHHRVTKMTPNVILISHQLKVQVVIFCIIKVITHQAKKCAVHIPCASDTI
jgi:hypothetical protein